MANVEHLEMQVTLTRARFTKIDEPPEDPGAPVTPKATSSAERPRSNANPVVRSRL
jgi:hypothetical protein